MACGESRLDYMIERDGEIGYIEAKSAALLIRGDTGSFPDCPTARGRKHVGTLRRLAGSHRCVMLFLVQHPDATAFAPNETGDPAFAASLAEAVRDGVEVRAVKMGLGANGDVSLEDPDLRIADAATWCGGATSP